MAATRWTAEEVEKRALLEQGVAVAVNMRRHGNLIAWADELGLFVRVDGAAPWGNLFVIGRDGDRETVIARYGDDYRLAEAQALRASMPTDELPERGPLPAGSLMPLAANPLFVGRSDELLQVARALRGGDVALGQVVASTGLGGLGRTQLAVELVLAQLRQRG